MLIPLDKIVSNPQQPRHNFDQAEMAELAESIRQHGVINPIAVEDYGDLYILIDGERRVRAARIAGLTEIEASVRPGLNGGGALERLILATVANVQRSDMTPLEKAKAFRDLAETGMTQGQIAKTVGYSLATVTNYLLILRLPATIQAHYGDNTLPNDARVVRSLLDLNDTDLQLAVTNAAVNRKMGGSEIITLARRMKSGRKQAKRLHMKGKQDLSVTWSGKWNMIAQIGNPRMSPEWKAAALGVCQVCPLVDDASPKICCGCAGAELLKKLVEGEK